MSGSTLPKNLRVTTVEIGSKGKMVAWDRHGLERAAASEQVAVERLLA